MYVDSHAHLSMRVFEQDLASVMERAREARVSAIMTCATSLRDAEANLEAAAGAVGDAPPVLASVGFHPHQAAEWDEHSGTRLREMIASHERIAAVGEVGLDYHYNFSAPEVQRDVLSRQIGLAREIGLPLIVHCRNAVDDMQEILIRDGAGETGGVLHCFSEDAAFARFCLDLGFYVSFSGIVTFRSAETVKEAARLVPLDRLLVETDSPYLAPVPHRGKRNEPAHVVEVTRAVATLKGLEVEAVAEATSANFRKLFDPEGRRLAGR